MDFKIWVLTPGKQFSGATAPPQPYELFNTDSIPGNGLLREFATFRHLYGSGATAAHTYSGTVSWKFENKAKISKAEFFQAIAQNPGFDVYFLNPFWLQLFWKNIWIQGDSYHPGILNYAQDAVRRAGHTLDLRSQTHDSTTFAFCNFWVGNQKFWDAFMAFALPIYDVLEKDLDLPPHKDLLVDRFNMQCGFFPYVMERMFTTFVATHKDLKVFSYRYSDVQLRERYNPGLEMTIQSMLSHEQGRHEEAFDLLRRSFCEHVKYKALDAVGGMDLVRELYGRVYRRLMRKRIVHEHPIASSFQVQDPHGNHAHENLESL